MKDIHKIINKWGSAVIVNPEDSQNTIIQLGWLPNIGLQTGDIIRVTTRGRVKHPMGTNGLYLVLGFTDDNIILMLEPRRMYDMSYDNIENIFIEARMTTVPEILEEIIERFMKFKRARWSKIY